MFRVCAIVFSALLLAACQEDPEESANRLFVEASTAIAEYNAIIGDDIEQLESKKNALAGAIANLNEIVSDYPTTSIAVKIVSNTVGDLKLADLEANLVVLERSIFCETNTADLECRFDAAIKQEIADIPKETSGHLVKTRLAALVVALAGVGRFDEAIELLPSIDALGPQLNYAISSAVAFSAAYDDLDSARLVIDARTDAYSAQTRERWSSIIPSLIENKSALASSEIPDFVETDDFAVNVARKRDIIETLVAKKDTDKIRREIMDLFLIVRENGSQNLSTNAYERFLEAVGARFYEWL